MANSGAMWGGVIMSGSAGIEAVVVVVGDQTVWGTGSGGNEIGNGWDRGNGEGSDWWTRQGGG